MRRATIAIAASLLFHIAWLGLGSAVIGEHAHFVSGRFLVHTHAGIAHHGETASHDHHSHEHGHDESDSHDHEPASPDSNESALAHAMAASRLTSLREVPAVAIALLFEYAPVSQIKVTLAERPVTVAVSHAHTHALFPRPPPHIHS